jgi:YYY domain-containing protein
MNSDILSILLWWFCLFGIGILFLPISLLLFSKFFDKGYIFAKTIGMCVISYVVLTLGVAHILPFERGSIFAILLVIALVNIYILRKKDLRPKKAELKIFIFQELLFSVSFLFWLYIKSFQPDVHGLEKYMDFGFMNSILRTSYFPPVDMWFPPYSINYYYFGHLVTAVLIKLTNIQPSIAFNLMLCSIFAFTTTSSFSIVSTLTLKVLKSRKTAIFSGILAALLTSLGGNLHTIYTLFRPYSSPENPVAFWRLAFSPLNFPNSYWYPNATRFIPFTIHEFPSYSFVVSDLHGHVLDIPFVFLTIAIILSTFLQGKITYKITLILSFMLAVMYMTNAWDGIIYFLLLLITIVIWSSDVLQVKKITGKGSKSFSQFWKHIKNKKTFFSILIKHASLAAAGYIIFAIPFNLSFKPFVSGIGVLCAPSFLVSLQKLGPLIFEPNHCQRTPFWMLVVLYGFFYFFAITLVVKIIKLKKTPAEFIFLLLLILLSTILIAAPEFIYAKDIYPAHYRANTMFKLGYQAFIMLSLVSSFTIAYLLKTGRRFLWLPISFVLVSFILMYSYFAVTAYFGNLKISKGIDGLSYLKESYPDDYHAISWIQKNIPGQPTIAEAQGDSYTDFGRISANTGLPTILGWTVHEWLWRGDYSFPQSRLDDIRIFYEGSMAQTIQLIKKYNLSYAYIGALERQKYPALNEDKFRTLGKVVFQKNNTRIYKF